MLEHIRGTIESKELDSVVVDVAGIGYKVFVPMSSAEKLTAAGKDVKFYIVESTAMYGGSTTLYGFLSREERDVFLLLKDAVPGAGAKKALDILDKISKSLPDFKKAILSKDADSLTGIFGFTKKTADKLISSLKERIGEITISGKEKWVKDSFGSAEAEAVAGLVALGYRENQSRDAVAKAAESGPAALSVEEIITSALRHL
jgi:Holliday junction DNA helicase RuvA